MENTDIVTKADSVKTDQSVACTKHATRLALKFIISAALIFWLLRDTKLNEIFAVVRSANTVLLAVALILNFVGVTIVAFRWRLLLRTQGMQASIPFLLRSCLVGMFFNNFLPSTIGGDASRAYDTWGLARNKASALAVVFVDRFLGLLALMLFALGALLLSNDLTTSLPVLYIWVPLATVVMLFTVWIIFLPPRPISKVITQIRLPFWRKLQDALINALILFQGHRYVLIRALGLSLLLQTNVIIHYYLIAKGLDFPIPFSSYCLIVPLSIFLMMVPISINAIGVRESVFAFFLGILGVSKPEAVAFAWLAYGMVLLQGLTGGLVYALRK